MRSITLGFSCTHAVYWQSTEVVDPYNVSPLSSRNSLMNLWKLEQFTSVVSSEKIHYQSIELFSQRRGFYAQMFSLDCL